MLLGTSKRIITPQDKVRLAGYATRKTVFDDVLEDIYTRVFWLSNTELNTDEIIIYADLIWFGEDFVASTTAEIRRIYTHIEERNIYFIASHNHSGPPTGNCFLPILETYDEKYTLFLRHQIIQAIQKAYADREEVRLERYRDSISLNVYRRVMLNNQIVMRPNYNYSCNQDLNLLVFRCNAHKVKGIIVHYPCHANISNDNYVMPDFPGIVLRRLDERYHDATSIYMQGAAADLRPNAVLGDQFVPLGYEYVKRFAEILFEKIETMFRCAEKEPIDKEPTSAEVARIRLPQEKRKIHHDIMNGEGQLDIAQMQWLAKVEEKKFRLYEDLRIQVLSFGSQFELFFFNAELSQSYEFFIKRLFPHAVAVSYANGMIGYVSDKKQIQEGGYEPEGSTIYFGLSGSYKPEIERLIKDKIAEIKGGHDETGNGHL